jgi:DNA primase
LPVLKESRQLKFMFLPEGEDPDTLVRARGKEAFLQLASAAEPAIEYLFSRLAEGLDLRNLDHQARLAGLAMPYIDKVPDGILRQLMSNRLRSLTGVTAGAASPSGGTTPRHAPIRPAGKASTAGVSAMSRRLLSLLLQNPALLLSLPTESRSQLSQQPDNDLFIEVVKYVDENPDVQPSEILGRWSGTAEHGVLLGLLERPMALPEPAMQAELAEGVERYLEALRRADHRQVLAEVRQEPSKEKFAEYWSLKRGR